MNAIADTRHAPDAVELAITRVLDAERAAREDILRTEAEAAALTEHARAGARAVAARVERRLRTVRATFEARAAREIEQLDAEAQEAMRPHELAAADLDRVDAACATLAERLTSAT